MTCVSQPVTFAAPTVDPQAVKNNLPASTEPGVMSNILSSQTAQKPTSLPPAVHKPQEQPSSLGPQAAQIKFVLKKIILEGNKVYSDQALAKVYQNKINTQISVAELQSIAQDITNFYRNNGYILSRAILPPQHVQNGIVRIQVIEGYIDHVSVIGFPKGARKIIQAYGDQIARSKPLKLSVMEHYLRLANEVPGLAVRGVLEPSKTNVGASSLNLSADQHTFSGYYSYDNYGTLYIGPLQNTFGASFNSIFLSGDTTHLTYVTTSKPKELKFYDISYRSYIGSKGFAATIGKNNSKTQPALNLAQLDIQGNSTTYYGAAEYPLWRTRSSNLTMDGGLNYLDSQVTSFNFQLYMDHIRSVRFGASYDFADRFRGSNLCSLHVEKGLNVAGASNNPNSLTTSRFGADGVFTKFVAQYARSQPVHGRFSVFFVANGQYSFNPLLTSEQFTVGGSQLGRGYDPAEILGDKGVSGTLELRMDYAPEKFLLKSFEPYIFYDGGVTWNIKSLAGVSSKNSITSAGFGSRFVFNTYLNGNLMFTQPLTKVVSAEQVVGRARNPRVFFSLVASV
jgi:hemolysin activation/secretion protein